MNSHPQSLSIFSKLSQQYGRFSFFRRLFFRARWQLCPFTDLAEMLPPVGHVLELGCGIGIFSHVVAQMYPRTMVLGVDENPNAIRAASRSSENLSNLRFENKDARQFSSDEKFDSIAMIDLLHHVPVEDQESVVQLAAQLLNPGGMLLCKDIDEKPSWMVGACYLHDMIQIHPPSFITNDTLRGYLINSGFEIISEKRTKTLYVPHLTYLARKK